MEGGGQVDEGAWKGEQGRAAAGLAYITRSVNKVMGLFFPVKLATLYF